MKIFEFVFDDVNPNEMYHSPYWRSIYEDPLNIWFKEQFNPCNKPYNTFIFQCENLEEWSPEAFENVVHEDLSRYYKYKNVPVILNEVQVMYVINHFEFLKPNSILYKFLNEYIF